jgi:hypothetical protein
VDELTGHLGSVLGLAVLPILLGGFHRFSPSDPFPILPDQFLKIRFKSDIHGNLPLFREPKIAYSKSTEPHFGLIAIKRGR